MVPARGLSLTVKAILATALIAFAGFSLSACSNTNDPRNGIRTAEDAVGHLLYAAAKGDVNEAKVVVDGTFFTDESIREDLSIIKSYLDEAGGLGRVSVAENRSKQMGAEHFVEVRKSDSDQIMAFVVAEDNPGEFFVSSPQPRETGSGIPYEPTPPDLGKKGDNPQSAT